MSVNYSKQERDKKIVCNKLIEYKGNVSSLEELYSQFSKEMDKIFEEPESIHTIKEAENIVNKMLSCIISSEFTVYSLIGILSYRYYTHTHSLNTCIYALCLGKKLRLTHNELQDLGIAALLHDLGKTQVNQTLLNKNGKLTSAQFKEVQKHSVYGYRIVKNLQVKKEGILKGIRHHHEKIDGSGYPDGLKKDEIHPFARIIGVCDIFDAVTTKRSYKDMSGTFEALMMMKKDMKYQLDPKIVNTFIGVFHLKETI